MGRCGPRLPAVVAGGSGKYSWNRGESSTLVARLRKRSSWMSWVKLAVFTQDKLEQVTSRDLRPGDTVSFGT